ncbi:MULTISPECIES: PLP-dependent aspartate aminotransferase family protein [unclassified Thermoactinomyces]|jgi:cystathionine gamma-lyase|uniref:trans-sulfuration enzyme family protein n=1 Tax=unclassified Thermoactinomyces TaxID=2634588 RepID=UPI0018DC0A06|nr:MULTISPECIES: aminotransferase class I/II-fold pyridoxal phosphate-dependent enzyme [unclassified Thermoactinomyces]MBH8597293.1 aminotransferase class I/II-fold pyridoxal phosphate-dependent enzyme [Thermoactinomyces sp. CICC 10523]MBH8606037.1 aminotransferase class I/II-fold pyridoxal phosphate-dependent enzyme [Thermoactinomyces sp. CICC 10521]
MNKRNDHQDPILGKLQNETLVIHADDEVTKDGTVAPAIYYSATFRAQDSIEFADMAGTPRHPQYYTRYGNPVHERVKKVMAELEGTETALVTGSGMGAIATTLLSLVSAGDHVIAQTRHYMSTAKIMDEMLPRFGVEVTLVEQADVSAFAAAIRPNTKLIMVESPANPTLVVTDLAAVAELARPRGIIIVADNTFASPINQRPHELGADVVVHSATKYLGGHHDLTAGVICTSEELAERIWHTHISIGSVLSPMDAWLLLRGLRTLPMRIERINANALALAKFLEEQPQIERVYYPGLPSHPQHELAKRQMSGFGGMIAFAIKGGYEATARFVSALKLSLNAVSLGGVDSLVVHTAAMWGGVMNEEQMRTAGIPPNFVRYSVGIEHIDDLKADVLQALQMI